ncbi:Methyltransferase [Forsythia ovata]|uniref:Methyltransferase n=1 Tax=Forsythia ovata TaxID=205694 RepID=A0ABD1UAM4_9LAMI
MGEEKPKSTGMWPTIKPFVNGGASGMLVICVIQPINMIKIWLKNVPYDWINKQKSNQHWLRKEVDNFLFPGGGTMFPNGVSEYVDSMQHMIPGMKDGTIRTTIDTRCEVASWGGDLLDPGILTISPAPRDNHEAQVQFALERGIPAILGTSQHSDCLSIQTLLTWHISQDA